MTRILEIGEVSRMRKAFPQTEFFSSFVRDTESTKPPGTEVVSAKTLIRLAGRLSDQTLDLIVVHALPHGPLEALIRTVFRRAALQLHLPLLRGAGQQLLRGRVRAPVAVLDMQDSSSIMRCNRYLLQAARIYFKRELPPDRWQLFQRSGRTPTIRYRRSSKYRSMLTKIRPLSLGLPDHMLAFDRSLPMEPMKDIDIFFAGRVEGSSTVRERGIEEVAGLAKEGLRVDINQGVISAQDYLKRCARSWLVWAPEGYGWDCFRTYEASFARSVPLISRQTIERHQPLIDGEHCFYYDVEHGGLTHAVRRALGDRGRLMHMAAAAREHVLRHHTAEALAHYVVNTTIASDG